MNTILKVLACASLSLGAASADATVITKTYSFEATGFQPAQDGTVSPSPTVTGSFTVTFDTAQDAHNQTTGIALNTLSIPYRPQLSFDYLASLDFLRIGAGDDNALVSSLISDFALTVGGASTASHGGGLTSFLFTNASPNHFFQADIVRVADVAAPGVPEPATWALMLSGFGLAGAGIRRRGYRISRNSRIRATHYSA